MTFIGKVLELISDTELAYPLGRAIESVAEAALAEDEAEQDAHLKNAKFFIEHQIGIEARVTEATDSAAEPERKIKPAAGRKVKPSNGKGAATSDARQRVCETCDEWKDTRAFKGNGQVCTKCQRKAART